MRVNKILKRYLFKIISLAFMAILAPSASAKNHGIKVETQNFLLRGDLSEAQAERLVNELGVFRHIMLEYLGKPADPEIIPVNIFVTQKTTDFNFLNDTQHGVSGLYSLSSDGPAFIVHGEKSRKAGKTARHIALHEYSHHLLAAYTDLRLPRWYNEGFTSFLANYETTKDGITLGHSYTEHIRSLTQYNWLPMGRILESVREYPSFFQDKSARGRKAISLYYAQTWLAVNYLETLEGANEKKQNYVFRLNRGEDPLKAFEASYGFSTKGFDRRLKAHFKARQFPLKSVKIHRVYEDKDISVRRLSKAELSFAAAESWRMLHKDSQKTDVERAFTRLAENSKFAARAHISKSKIALRYQDYLGAIDLAQRALQINPQAQDAQMIAARANVEGYLNLGMIKGVNIFKARQYLYNYLQQNPEDVSAHYYHALSYQYNSAVPDDALESALLAAQRYKSYRYIPHQLKLAEVLSKGMRYEAARGLVDFTKMWSGDPAVIKYSEQLTDVINIGEKQLNDQLFLKAHNDARP